MSKIKVYTSENCGPCHDIARLIEEGKFQGADEVELVDIESEEGFHEFSEILKKQNGGAVPSAYKDGQKCRIQLSEDSQQLIFSCEESPVTEESRPEEP